MFIKEEDIYIECVFDPRGNEAIKEANELYEIIMNDKKTIDKYYLYYFESMNKYINKYQKFRLKLIKTYIEDLKCIISFHNLKYI